NGEVAIVTGAGRGIGAAIAQTLGAAGARVAVNDINAGNAEKVAKAIRDAGGRAIATAGDVANKFQCVDVIETTRSEWGQLDILINNAAVEPAVSVLKMDEWDFQRCLDVNLKGTFFMSQLVGRVMVDENGERGGSIVNIASSAGVQTPLVDRSAYCASKAGIVGFAKECAREFAQYNIRVNTVLPGIIDTPLIERLKEDPEKLAYWEKSIPLGRLGEDQDVANMVIFLASSQASYLTGGTFTVDGGRVMR
ncbi:MAG: SDR family NAD(P)-dependent oxidoreductase, partial [Chloroflexota bacterium]